nr:UDP-N-acetylmuramoyl-tripeptide--D-alanyl-D-alanine ligase [Motiliproteus sp. SC1-56]
MQLSSLVTPLGGELQQGDARFSRVSTDTRSLQAGELFVALSGPSFDGNQFVAKAAEKGAVGAIVSRLQPVALPQLVVADTLQALGQLGALRREAFNGPVVAITGSSGKTSVKEMLAAILRTQGETLATRGNLNNAIGAPLTLLELTPAHRYAVIELGASGAGEIAYTVGLARPEVAVLNNAGGAHLEGFGSLEGVVRAKGEIFDGVKPGGTGVVNLDDANAEVWLRQLKGRPHLTFSLVSAHADLFASHLEQRPGGAFEFVLNTHRGQVGVQLQVLGHHAVANALAAAAAAQALGVELDAIREGLESFTGVSGRLASYRAQQGARVIDDSYNANPDSVRAALEVLAAQPGQRFLVLGDMAELGAERAALHAEVGRRAAEAGIDGLLATGPLGAESVRAFAAEGGAQGHAFADKAALLAWLSPRLSEESVILVKGSRSAGMETVVEALRLKENR